MAQQDSLAILTAVQGADGRLYRAAIYRAQEGGFWGECLNPGGIKGAAYGQGDTFRECREDLAQGVNALLEVD